MATIKKFMLTLLFLISCTHLVYGSSQYYPEGDDKEVERIKRFREDLKKCYALTGYTNPTNVDSVQLRSEQLKGLEIQFGDDFKVLVNHLGCTGCDWVNGDLMQHGRFNDCWLNSLGNNCMSYTQIKVLQRHKPSLDSKPFLGMMEFFDIASFKEVKNLEEAEAMTSLQHYALYDPIKKRLISKIGSAPVIVEHSPWYVPESYLLGGPFKGYKTVFKDEKQ